MIRNLKPLLTLAACLLAAPTPAAASEGAEFAVRGGLPNVAAKAVAGGEVRVAFLGGSITAAQGWRVHALTDLRRAYPKTSFTEIFAAVSGTGSNYGVARLERDVLRHRPDLVLVEFAVNDGTGSPLVEAQMEGIVRQTWNANPHTDLCLVYTVAETQLSAWREGRVPTVVQAMEKIAVHYGIPSLHFSAEVLRRLAAGQLVFSAPASALRDAAGRDAEGRLVFTHDKVHPTPAGHLIYAERLALALPEFFRSGRPGPHWLPTRLTSGQSERARLVPLAEIASALHGAWRALPPDDPLARQAGRMAPPIHATFAAGASVAFRFKGTRLGLIGLKGADNGEFRVTVDDLPTETGTFFDRHSLPGRHVLKPWFSAHRLADTEHRVRIELLGTRIDKAAVMRGVAVDVVGHEAFRGHGLYLCGLLLEGEMVAPPAARE